MENNCVVITGGIQKKYGIGIGDTFTIHDKLTNKDVTVTTQDIYPYDLGQFIFANAYTVKVLRM